MSLKITVLKIGKPKMVEYTTLSQVFIKRLGPFAQIKDDMIPSKNGVEKDTKSLLTRLDKLGPCRLIALHEHGPNWDSKALADKITQWESDPGIRHVCFLIGGPYGLAQEVLDRCHDFWALSNGTFPSDMAWLMTWEQVYRAYSIKTGSPYHHA